MTLPFIAFIDITGANAAKAPLVKDGLRAYYATGSSGIEETAAQILAAKNAGMSITLYDQTASLSVFAVGMADMADVENFAGTPAAAAAAVTHRQARGWQSTLYVSYSRLPELKAAIRNPAGVWYGIADYSWSEAQAQQLLDHNPDWAYVQYGDPASNPATLVPGTNVTLQQAQADINVARYAWAAQFLPHPAPPPAPPHAGPYRHVTKLGDTLGHLAATRNETIPALIANSARHYTAADLAAVEAALGVHPHWPLPAGLPWYTVNP